MTGGSSLMCRSRTIPYTSLWWCYMRGSMRHLWNCQSVESPWTQWTPWTFTMDSVDSLDNVHGALWTKSSESMDKVQWDQPDWTMSIDSVDIVHGLSGQPGSPGRLDNVHGQSPLSPWTDWTLSMDSLDFVQSDLVENKTCRWTGKLACNCAFPLWSILESYIYSYQTRFKSIKGFADTDTVNIKHKKFKVHDLDLKAMYWDGDGHA